MDQEAWADIPGHEGAYQASDIGRVRSLPRTIVTADGKRRPVTGRILAPLRHPAGHFMISLGRGRRAYVHRLVMEAFVGPCPPGMMACHNNGNPADNRLENLRYSSARDNQMDRVPHGTSNRGAANGKSILTPDDVVRIRHRLAAGERQRSIAAAFGVTQCCISDINLGKTWSHLA